MLPHYVEVMLVYETAKVCVVKLHDFSSHLVKICDMTYHLCDMTSNLIPAVNALTVTQLCKIGEIKTLPALEVTYFLTGNSISLV